MAQELEPPTDAAALRGWLKQLREDAGLSQEQAGEAVGVDEREIRRWENENAPGGVRLLKLLSAYGVTFTPSPPEEVPVSFTAEIKRLRKELSDHGISSAFAPSTDHLTERERRILEIWGGIEPVDEVEAEELLRAYSASRQTRRKRVRSNQTEDR